MDSLRKDIQARLEGGLETVIEPRGYTSEEVIQIVSALQNVESDDLDQKLVISGFTLNPYNPTGNKADDQACETCMYYVIHRRFCELPELMLPVEAEWSCRLWRI